MKPTINALFAEPICLYEKINIASEVLGEELRDWI